LKSQRPFNFAHCRRSSSPSDKVKNPFKIKRFKTLPPLNFSENLNHLISFSISLSITDSPHHVETEKVYPSLVQPLADSSLTVADSSPTRRLPGNQPVQPSSSVLLLLLSSSSNSLLTLHVHSVSIQILYF
jgi:hypothetical protein